MQADRTPFYAPDKIAAAVEEQLELARRNDQRIDYLCFVPDGEPTLDANLENSIARVKEFGIPVALITNASLLQDAGLREELLGLDWISLKIDAGTESVWRCIDRPFKTIGFHAMHTGMRAFAERFDGILTTESMLIHSLNSDDGELESMAEAAADLQPDISYLAIPTRPPAESWVRPAEEQRLAAAFRIFSRRIDRVELLIGYEGNAFSYTGDAAHDILSITAVHPMREDALQELLQRDKADRSTVQRLIDEGKLLRTEFQGHAYYLRKFREKQMGSR
jgi:wyosine [tRNA(Phe)-imidazoG37] synthetase (radical SAM superfamily)